MNRTLVKVAGLGVLWASACNVITGASDLKIDDATPASDRPAPVGPAPPATGTPPRSEAGAPDASADGADSGARGVLRVFVTSVLRPGALGGLTSADKLCTELANVSNMTDGTWVAWLSTTSPGGVDAIDRLKADGEWRLVTANGPRVAANKAMLASGKLEHAIDHDEKNQLVSGQIRVWTGTSASGNAAMFDCAGWTAAANGQGGTVGQATLDDDRWTSSAAASCAQQARVYCFEQ